MSPSHPTGPSLLDTTTLRCWLVLVTVLGGWLANTSPKEELMTQLPAEMNANARTCMHNWDSEKSCKVSPCKYIQVQDYYGGRNSIKCRCGGLIANRAQFPHVLWASQVALEVKNPPDNTGDTRDVGSIPGLGRPPGGGHGNPLQYSCLENPMDRGAGGLQFMESQSQTRLSTHTPISLLPGSMSFAIRHCSFSHH